MIRRVALPIVFALAFLNLVVPVQAQFVPGTGQQIVEVFDDFEDPTWDFTLNLPKSSANIDKVERHPSGFSSNGKFLESMYRGTPDFVRRVETPEGGIPGSTGSLAMQTLNSGIPGSRSHTFQQDDLIAAVQNKLGYSLPASWAPSYVCRVYVPPFEKWERRNGSHFGFRADCVTTITTPTMGRFFKNVASMKKQEQYWPGFFIQLNMKNMTGAQEDSAVILIRSDERGHEVPGPKITKPGWWTLGMSFTPDGRVHYYAHEGVANLTAKDHIYSNFPYGYKCEQTTTYFFNIVNQDDGRSWSTRWIVDDPKVYVASGNYRPTVQPQVAAKPVTPAAPAATTAQAPSAPAPTQVPAAIPAQSPAALPAQPPVATAGKAPEFPVQAPAAQVPAVATQPTATATQPVAPVRPQTPAPAVSANPPAVKTTQAPAAPVTIAKPQAEVVKPRLATTPASSMPAQSIPALATKPNELPKVAAQPEVKPQPVPATDAKAEPKLPEEPKSDAQLGAPNLLPEAETKAAGETSLVPSVEAESKPVEPASAEAPATADPAPQTPPAPAEPQ